MWYAVDRSLLNNGFCVATSKSEVSAPFTLGEVSNWVSTDGLERNDPSF